MSEAAGLADQIRRAYDGEAWHGDSLLEILADVDAKTAAAHPIPDAHSIWELVLHVAAWDTAVKTRAGGKAIMLEGDANFPPVKDSSESAWRKTVEDVKKAHNELIKTVEGFSDARLREQVPGKKGSHYNFYYMFSGIVQHELYHAGQIALLKKAQRGK